MTARDASLDWVRAAERRRERDESPPFEPIEFNAELRALSAKKVKL